MQDLVVKILSPTRPVRFNGSIHWVRQNVPLKLRQRAELLREDIMGEFRFFGMLRRNEIWGLLGNPPIKDLEKKLSDTKLQLYKKYPDEFWTKNSRKEIKDILRQINSILIEYNLLDAVTLESYAEKQAAIYTTSKLAKTTLDTAYFLYHRLILDGVPVSEIRKLARSDYWQSLYDAKSPFKYYPLTDEQIALASYTRLYRNLHRHPEPPPPDIVNDDDLLDGWLIAQSKPRRKEMSFGHKIDSAKEIFVMAQDKEHAKSIYDMNTDEARAIQQVRMRQLRSTNGGVPFSKLADVQTQRLTHAKR